MASTGNLAGQRPLGRATHTWEHKTKIDLKKKQDGSGPDLSDKLQGVVNTVINLGVP